MEKPIIHGIYSALEYTVWQGKTEIYRAGNGHGDSQTYVSAREGVGREKMREYCESTVSEIAAERGAIVGRVDLEDDSPDDDGNTDYRCNQCSAMMINNVYAHETGCPNSGKVKLDNEWCVAGHDEEEEEPYYEEEA